MIGDLCAFHGPDGQPLPGVAPVAIQQGRPPRPTCLRRLAGAADPALPLPRQGQHGHDRPRRRGRRRRPPPALRAARLARLALRPHLFLIGFRNRFLVLFEWAWAYFTWQRGARLITGLLASPA